MANISIRPTGTNPGVCQIIINGVDFSREIYREGMRLVRVGQHEEFAEVGLQVTFAVTQLDLGDEQDIVVTDQFRSVAQRVGQMVSTAEEDGAGE